MEELLFWTWVVGGTPLALDLIVRMVEWLLDTIGAGSIARGSAARERQARGRSLLSWHG